MAREHKVMTRFDAKEMAKLKRFSKKLGMPMGTYLRFLLTKQKVA
jgi:hypothetical protein